VATYCSLFVLNTHAGNFTDGIREFGEFEPHRQLLVSVGCDTLNIAVNFVDLLVGAQRSAVVRCADFCSYCYYFYNSRNNK